MKKFTPDEEHQVKAGILAKLAKMFSPSPEVMMEVEPLNEEDEKKKRQQKRDRDDLNKLLGN